MTSQMGDGRGHLCGLKRDEWVFRWGSDEHEGIGAETRLIQLVADWIKILKRLWEIPQKDGGNGWIDYSESLHEAMRNQDGLAEGQWDLICLIQTREMSWQDLPGVGAWNQGGQYSKWQMGWMKGWSHFYGKCFVKKLGLICICRYSSKLRPFI